MKYGIIGSGKIGTALARKKVDVIEKKTPGPRLKRYRNE
jgi:hypothetical protein